MSRNDSFANGTTLWIHDETGLKTVQNQRKMLQIKE
jgi:hypothetical protein